MPGTMAQLEKPSTAKCWDPMWMSLCALAALLPIQVPVYGLGKQSFPILKVYWKDQMC